MPKKLLRSASLSASVFVLDDEKMLLNIEKGWLIADIVRFVLKQPEVVKVVKDNKDYFPGDVPDDDDGEDL